MAPFNAVLAIGLFATALAAVFYALRATNGPAASGGANGQFQAGYQAGVAEASKTFQRRDNLLRDLEALLRTSEGGIGKRIAQSREFAVVMQHHAPHLFKEVDGLASWFYENDQFQLKLLGQFLESDGDKGGQQSRLALIHPQSIFTEIFDTAGISPPGSTFTKHFAVSRDAGLVAVRSLGKHGASGKLLMSKSEVTRLFNDLVVKPRPLDGAKSPDWASAGLFRVETPDDPMTGQLLVTAMRPGAGRLYLGHPDREGEVLADLRNLKNACQVALDQSKTLASRRMTAHFGRHLRRSAPDANIPESGLCSNCEGDVTTRLRPGANVQACPICADEWGQAA